MCFTPAVSLATALIEWCLALILIISFRKSKLAYIFSIVFVLLGLYQFTEFMLCFSMNLIWAKIGFIAYTFLPALGLQAAFIYLNKRVTPILLYIIPVIYTIFAIFSTSFVLSATCMPLFVSVNLILSQNSLFALPYMAYYALSILLAFIFMVDECLETKDKRRKKVSLLIALAIICMTIPTLIVTEVFPMLHVAFPSVLCHFALFLAILVFIAVSIDSKR